MASQIASLFVKIGANVNDFDKGLRGIKSDMSGMEKTSAALGSAFKAAFAIGTVAVVAFGAAIGKTVQAAADMEQQVADIRSIFGKTAPAAAELNDEILKLGLDPKLKVSATQAAEAIQMLGKNGLTMSEIIGGATRNTILLANATGDNFSLAADIATDVMKQFNVSASNMSKAVDGIVGVTQASKFDINDYALAIAQAGGVASSVGVSLDDFNAIIAATSSSFASGSDAGTSFKVFLQRLVPATDPAREAMSKLGLITAAGGSAFFDAAGKMKSAEEIAGLLSKAFMGLSDAERIEAASRIFGTDAMRTALALAEGGMPVIANMKKLIGDTSAEQAAATRMDTFRGALEIAQGIIETLSISIGQKFLPVLRPLVEKFSELAQTYGPMVVEWFGKVAERMGAAITGFLNFRLALEDGDGALMNFLKALGLNEAMAQKIGQAYWFLTQNIGTVIETIKFAIKPITDVIAKFVTWKDVTNALAYFITSALVGGIVFLIGALWPVIQVFAAVVTASAALRWAWQNDFMSIRTFTKNMVDKITDWFFNSSGIWKGTFEKTLEYFKWWADGGWKNFIYFPVRSWLLQMVRGIEQWARETRGKITTWIADAKQWFESGLSAIIHKVLSWRNDIIAAIQHWTSAAIREVSYFATQIRQNFDYMVNQWMSKVRAWRDDMLEKLGTMFAWFKPSEWLAKGRAIIQGLWDGAQTVWNRFKSWWNGLWSTLTGAVDVKLRIGSPSKEMAKRGASAIEGFANGAKRAMPMVTDALGGLANISMGAASEVAYTGPSTRSSAPAVSTSRIEELLVLLIQELRAKNMTANVAVMGGGGGGLGDLVTLTNGLR